MEDNLGYELDCSTSFKRAIRLGVSDEDFGTCDSVLEMDCLIGEGTVKGAKFISNWTFHGLLVA